MPIKEQKKTKNHTATKRPSSQPSKQGTEAYNQSAPSQEIMQRVEQTPRLLTTKDVLHLQRKFGNQAVHNLLQRRADNRATTSSKHADRTTAAQQKSTLMRETITFADDEADVIVGDRHAKTWDKYIEQYNGMINTTIRNLRDAWQDGVNTFQTQMQFPSAGEAQPKIGQAMLKAATNELVGYLIGEVGDKYPGVGKAIGAVKGIATAIYDEQKRAEAAAQGMSLGHFITRMRTGMGDSLNDLAAQSAIREDALRTDFTQNHLDQDSEYDKVQWYKRAIQQLGSLKLHSGPITRSLAETWFAENFKQESNSFGQIVTTGVIELKYEVYEQDGMKVYSFKHCKVVMPQGDRVAKAINTTYAGKPIDLKSFKCRKRIILENSDNRYKSEEGILDANNEKVAGFLGAFGWYQGLPRGLNVGRFDES